MKKVLFISFNYPKGNFGPSTNCTLRIMKELCSSGRYEVHCLSYTGDKNTYDLVPQVICHEIPLTPPDKKRHKFVEHLRLLFSVTTFPFNSLSEDRKHYKACRDFLPYQQFDIVIGQYATEPCLKTAIELKKAGCINKLVILFWDGIYGKLPRRFIPKSFAIRRQRKAEDEIAKYADVLVSLYPIKEFHDKFGDVPNAIGKRVYLGIPSIIKPMIDRHSTYEYIIQKGKINILYSGTIYRASHLTYIVSLLNKTQYAPKINLVFFCKGVSKDVFEQLQPQFKGSIFYSSWIPVDELLALYTLVDFFVSFPGNPRSICSKVYEYMSYGKPVILLSDSEDDVNVSTFSRYPACISIKQHGDLLDNCLLVEDFITHNLGRTIPYNETLDLFKSDSPGAYVELIDRLLGINYDS